MVFLTEEWFWRGTQSAIFYYASCSPYVEYKHKRKRRLEAQRSRKEKEDFVYIQPGMIRQPAPFQTNKQWVEEIVAGPGPPKGWQKDAVYHEYTKAKKQDALIFKGGRPRGETAASNSSPAKSDWTTANSSASTTVPQSSSGLAPGVYVSSTGVEKNDIELSVLRGPSREGPKSMDGADRDLGNGVHIPGEAQPSHSGTAHRQVEGANHITSNRTETTGSRRSSFNSSSSSKSEQAPPRPSMDRRISQAMDGFKETVRSALHPDHWNWIRYDRDDEVLPNLNERMKSMWGNMKTNITSLSEDNTLKLKQMEARENDKAQDIKKWQRGTHPAINDLHPPTASQLPLTQDEARWMLMPPASADVMMGRRRPNAFEDTKRVPLCLIGRPIPEPTIPTIPNLQSEEFEEAISSTEDEDWLPTRAHVQKPQRAHLKRMQTDPVRTDYFGNI